MWVPTTLWMAITVSPWASCGPSSCVSRWTQTHIKHPPCSGLSQLCDVVASLLQWQKHDLGFLWFMKCYVWLLVSVWYLAIVVVLLQLVQLIFCQKEGWDWLRFVWTITVSINCCDKYIECLATASQPKSGHLKQRQEEMFRFRS